MLRLNTAVGGAEINSGVTLNNFPVLVRLDAQNFNFATAKTDGSDLRFSLTDGTLLLHEIESWNAASQQATVWVKIPSLAGDNTDQNITMRWGNTAATAVSNGTQVFTNNYNSVWHLGEQLPTVFRNAVTGSPAVSYTVTTPVANKSGLIGQGQLIAKGQYAQYIGFPGPSAQQTEFTLSA